MKINCLLLSALALSSVGSAADLFRTDINPALRYYQGYLLLPDLPEADHSFLFVEEWRGRPLEARFGDLIAKYDNSFKVFQQAGQAQVPCDWGLDLSEGPRALLPGLARAKNAAQIARLRVLWNLQNGRERDARDDLIAAFTLGRNTSKDDVIISALVQYAIEHIVVSIVAENFYRFSPQTLEEIISGLEAAPERGGIARCLPTEKAGFFDWTLRKFDEVRDQHPGQEKHAYEQMLLTLNHLLDDEINRAKLEAQLAQATGGNSERLVALVRELEPLFARVSSILAMPYPEFRPRIRAFAEEMLASKNPLVPTFFSIYEKCGIKQFAAEVDVAMLKAAVAYKIHGPDGLKSVKDPCGSGPFGFRRFVFNQADRGFELRSSLDGRGFDSVLIFVEKEGPLFQVMGLRAGQAVAPTR